jgi:prephenate dehydrogenase
MAGHPRGGIENATSDLFVDKKWILCAEQSSQEATDFVRDFVHSLGALPIHLSAADHDRSVAITSHLPQVIASALSVLAQKNDALKAAGPGFASATRVAGGQEEMWKDIFESNGAAIADALGQASSLFQELSTQLAAGEIEGVLQLLRGARSGREPRDR